MRTTCCPKKVIVIIHFLSLVVSQTNPPLKWQQYSLINGQNGPRGRKFHAFGFDPYRQFLIVFGGSAENGDVLNDTWVLDITAGGRWYEVKNEENRPNGRYGSIYGIYNGQLILATGCDLKKCFDDMWSFNAASFLWTRIQADGLFRPKPRRHAAGGIFTHGKHLVISGGMTTNGEYLSDTYVFDLSQSHWHQVEAWQSSYDPSSPHPRAFEASTMIEENILVTFGGCIKHGPCPSAASWTYNWQINKWVKLANCPMARSFATMTKLSINNYNYAILFGGSTSGRQIISARKKLKDNELTIFDPGKNGWTIKLVEGIKFPGSRVGAAFANGHGIIYLFGGEINGKFPNDLFILSGDPNSTLSDACGDSFFTLISLHGLFMFFGFAILLQFGGALAQYSSIIKEPPRMNWRYIHRVTQALGLLFVVVAFVCGIAIIPDGHRHFQSVHGGLGLFIFILLLLQAFFGFLSKHYHELRSLILIVHFWNGVALLLLSYLNISLGLFLAMSPTWLWVAWFIYVLSLFGVGCFVLAYDCCKGKRFLSSKTLAQATEIEKRGQNRDLNYPMRVSNTMPYSTGNY